MLLRHQKLHATPQDQGFTRPTVLVLLPFRSHALAFIQALLALLPPCYEQVENKARFVKEYDEDEGSTPMPLSKPPRTPASPLEGKHASAHHGAHASPQVSPRTTASSLRATTTTASGARRGMHAPNTAPIDRRPAVLTTAPSLPPRCALRLTKKAAKLYSSFYSADLILASPLGLRSLLDGGGAKGKDSKRTRGAQDGADADWLSSIELTLLPYADVMLMQVSATECHWWPLSATECLEGY